MAADNDVYQGKAQPAMSKLDALLRTQPLPEDPADDEWEPYEFAAEQDGWDDVYDNVVTLTAYLAGAGYEPSEVAYAVEKPWKFRREFITARAEMVEVVSGRG